MDWSFNIMYCFSVASYECISEFQISGGAQLIFLALTLTLLTLSRNTGKTVDYEILCEGNLLWQSSCMF